MQVHTILSDRYIHRFKIQTNTHLSYNTTHIKEKWKSCSGLCGFRSDILIPKFCDAFLALNVYAAKFLSLRIVKSTPLKFGKITTFHSVKMWVKMNKQIADKYTHTWHEYREIIYFRISPPWWIREAQCLKYVPFCCGFSAILSIATSELKKEKKWKLTEL